MHSEDHLQPEHGSDNNATDVHGIPVPDSRDANSSGEMPEPAANRLKSPFNSFKGERPSDFPVAPMTTANGGLWTEGEPPWPRNAAFAAAVMIKPPETRPISQEQLVAEVKGIYAGLVMVEPKCIEVYGGTQSTQPASETSARLNNEQWQALIALHRTLLHEHHDFFLASQHPSASPALRKLARKYAMPARMWRHGIHSFLELLRHRLPTSIEHMLAFIYLAYSTMALLYETVPASEDTWTECLSDLGRYRMATENEDIRDREIWTGVSPHWYAKMCDKSRSPTNARLYHHLAILARPNAVQQLFYYTKSLYAAIPFHSARENVSALFNPFLRCLPDPPGFALVGAHGIVFAVSDHTEERGRSPLKLEDLVHEASKNKADFLALLDGRIARTTRSWIEPDAFISIANANASLEYGCTVAYMVPPYEQGDVIMDLFSRKAGARLEHIAEDEDGGTHACCHGCAHYFEIGALLRQHKREGHRHRHYLYQLSVDSDKPSDWPLFEDWTLRGLLWTDCPFPAHWLRNYRVDDDGKIFELPSMTEYRRERVLWHGWNLRGVSSAGSYFAFEGAMKCEPVRYSISKPNTYVSRRHSHLLRYESLAASEYERWIRLNHQPQNSASSLPQMLFVVANSLLPEDCLPRGLLYAEKQFSVSWCGDVEGGETHSLKGTAIGMAPILWSTIRHVLRNKSEPTCKLSSCLPIKSPADHDGSGPRSDQSSTPAHHKRPAESSPPNLSRWLRYFVPRVLRRRGMEILSTMPVVAA